MFDKEYKPVVNLTETGENCLELSSVYPNNCSEQKTEIITNEVIDVYNDAFKELYRKRS